MIKLLTTKHLDRLILRSILINPTTPLLFTNFNCNVLFIFSLGQLYSTAIMAGLVGYASSDEESDQDEVHQVSLNESEAMQPSFFQYETSLRADCI